MKASCKPIAAVVVLYNPDERVLENIESYAQGVDRLYVVDNSPLPQSNLTHAICSISHAEYIGYQKNLGVAAALNIGARRAKEAGCEWIVTMDQDSRFVGESFQKLLAFTRTQESTKTGITSPLHDSVILSKPKGEIEEMRVVMTSGSFVSLYAYELIGGFDERFFIDALDWDFAIRLNRAGFKVLRHNLISLRHELGERARIERSLFGKARLIQNYNPLRRYYITRNKLLIARLHQDFIPDMAWRWRVSILADIRNIMLYEDQKWAKIGAIIEGVKDFFQGRFYAK